MSISGPVELIRQKKVNSSGCQQESQSPMKTGMQENQTISSKFQSDKAAKCVQYM